MSALGQKQICAIQNGMSAFVGRSFGETVDLSEHQHHSAPRFCVGTTVMIKMVVCRILSFGPILLTLLLIIWTILVSPYSQYGDNWAIYPPMALLPLAVVWHVYQIVSFKPKWPYVVFFLVHIPAMFVILLYCMFQISKDSL
jgi:hypothetical protein